MEPNLRQGKQRWWIALAILVTAVGIVVLGYLRSTEVEIVRIGVLHSLTGPMAASERPLVDAVRLAVEEANQSGGVNGAQIEMVVEDCRSDAAYCAQRAEKLITRDGVRALFGCWTSACRKAVKPVVERYHSLLFYPVQYEGLEQSRSIVYTGAVPNQQLIPMVNWALQHRGTRVYMVGSDYVYPHIAHALVGKLLHAKGGRIVAERYVPLDATDLDAIAQEIAAKRPDFVLNTLNGESNRYLFKALKKYHVQADDIPVFSTSLAEVELAAIGPELVAGHYAAWNYFQSLDNPDNRAFVARFRQRFGAGRVLDDPMEAAYIGVKLWVQAVRNSGTTEIATVCTRLQTDSLRAPEGIVVMDGDTLHMWKTVRIGQVRADGQFELVWQSHSALEPAPFPFFLTHAERRALRREAR